MTGITDADVAGKRIDDEEVENFLNGVDLVIAHNASFDRRMAERRFPCFKAKAWGCSQTQIPWKREGLAIAKLEFLAYQMGFFYDKHRATSDCLAGIHILAGKLPRWETPLSSALDNARKKAVRIGAEQLVRPQGYAEVPRLHVAGG